LIEIGTSIGFGKIEAIRLSAEVHQAKEASFVLRRHLCCAVALLFSISFDFYVAAKETAIQTR
jgi:hypothetical protein